MDYFSLIEKFTVSFFVFLFGLCFGSFLDCVSYRTVNGKSAFIGLSKCDFCGRVLSFTDLIPVFGYIINKGKCRYCGKKLSIRYPLGELTYSIILILLYLKLNNASEFVFSILFVSFLFVSSVSDIIAKTIPDRFIVYGLSVDLIKSIYRKNAVESILIGIFISGFILLVSLVTEKIKNRTLIGGGDIKLIFVVSVFFGFPNAVLSLFLSCLLFLLFYIFTRKNAVSFAPFISVGSLFAIFFGNCIINVYISIFFR